MCGITGFQESPASRKEEARVWLISRMTSRLKHRGPNDDGAWVDSKTGIALGHRRLSIIDLSSMGKQPMHSESGRYVLTFNGEIYNYKDLRTRLCASEQPPHFRGHSDTEVMLAAFEHWGVTETTKQLIGMFAFALWDREDRCLYLSRDRLGQKPLYYGWAGRTFLFASELNALREHPAFESKISEEALGLFLRYSYVPAPHSIFKGIYKLQPGCILKLSGNGSGTPAHFSPLPVKGPPAGTLCPIPYWSAKDIAETKSSHPLSLSPQEAVSELEKKIADAVKMRMISDVPLGAFLSGGLDSSTIVALMQAQSPRPVKTFTIGFHSEGFDEAVHAKEIARHLGTEHTELYLTPQDALNVIPQLPKIYDEPFADTSQIPTFLVAEMARKHVTVALSGDGGDELFGGYNRYFLVPSIWKKTAWIPAPLRQILAHLLVIPSPAHWEAALSIASPLLKRYGKNGSFGDKFHKLATVLKMRDPDALYQRLVSSWASPQEALAGSRGGNFTNELSRTNLKSPELRMMLYDTLTYLPDDILTKVDRASMAVSLEARAPFLDHRVAQFAWSLPVDLKIRGGQGKWILREVLHKYVPRNLFERPKMGFGVPIAQWLRGPLRDWAESLLSEHSLKQSGLLNPRPIRKYLAEHVSGSQNREDQLWSVLMFQQWLKYYEK